MLVRSSVRGCCLVGFWQCTRSSRISDFVYSDVSGRQWTEIRVHRTGLNFFLCNRYFDVGHQIIIKFGSPVHVYVRGVGLCSFTWNWTLTRWDDRKSFWSHSVFVWNSNETGGPPCSFNFSCNQACAMTVRSSNVFFFCSVYFGTLGVGYIPFF
jgi:hypothetical protein